ncbi:hypothetical protein VTK73DRAFT_2040 [Phialemonium thermophilum]|uniref:Uncharacterized protein n=1 Tax=Phialemonium thermophilum TaxID=223376 RepID=A0ABR3VSN0_9PEZI
MFEVHQSDTLHPFIADSYERHRLLFSHHPQEVSTVTTAEQYRRYATAKNIQPALEDVGYGAQAAWFGSPAAQRVIVYIPGGGFVYYAAPGDMNLAHEMYLAASADDGDVAVAVMAYETARKMPYPNILRQIGALVAHLMKGRDPANVSRSR